MDSMSFALICGAVGVAYGLFTTTWVLKQDAGNPRMQEISAAVREGANAFLNRQYKTVAMVGAGVFVLLLGLGKYTAIGFVIGATGSALAGYVGLYVSVRSNGRTAQAAIPPTAANWLSAMETKPIATSVRRGTGMPTLAPTSANA